MRSEYLAVPAGALTSAGTVMLDWNISARIANIHRRQGRCEPLNLAAVEVERLRRLVAAIPKGAEILGAFGAAEPETRRTHRVADVERYNERTDIASVYLSQVPDYLLHLLDGGESGGLIIESTPDEVPFASDALRVWFMVSYAALLKAVVLHRARNTSRTDRRSISLLARTRTEDSPRPRVVDRLQAAWRKRRPSRAGRTSAQNRRQDRPQGSGLGSHVGPNVHAHPGHDGRATIHRELAIANHVRDG